MAPIKKERLKPGDIINEFEVVKIVKDHLYRPFYQFRCLNCGKTFVKALSQIRTTSCTGCKTIEETKNIYESLKNKTFRGYRCIGYDIEFKRKAVGILIFECTKCGKTVKVSALGYKSYLLYCECFKHPRRFKDEIIRDFTITSTDTFIGNSNNIKYIARCKHCGHTIQGQHCYVVKKVKEGCKHHICVNGKFVAKSCSTTAQIKKYKENNNEIKSQKSEIDILWQDFNLMKKVIERVEKLTSEKIKIKYKKALKDLLKRLN